MARRGGFPGTASERSIAVRLHDLRDAGDVIHCSEGAALNCPGAETDLRF